MGRMNDPFDTPPRPVEPGEYPVWDEALALVNRDLAATLPERAPLRLTGLPGWEEDEAPHEHVHVALADGTWWGNHLPDGSDADPVSALFAVAEAAQDTVSERLWQAWPVCSEHNLGMHLREADERAVWWCPQDHVRAAVGALDTVQRPPGARRGRGARRA
ncbi:hypothetical protein E4U92_06485 [Streptomyces galbus]|uniref:Uncharacterized protein n=2 Tax=Streptomyces galbus TaxID=33898 RepID=A0A4U5X6I4_STRGB|nr:hypothetical protein E4U92_06485 [Streptomyces galbus]